MGWERLKNFTLDNLLMEMEKTTVEKQSDLLNKVQLMETKQERDEPEGPG